MESRLPRHACPARGGATTPYFAWRDEHGVTSFYFCDGATFTTGAHDGARFEPAPAELGRGRRVSEKQYRLAVDRFPREAILAPPPEAVSAGGP